MTSPPWGVATIRTLLMFRKYKAAIDIKEGHLAYRGSKGYTLLGGKATQTRCLSREGHGVSKSLSRSWPCQPPGSVILLSPSQASRTKPQPTWDLLIAFQRTTCFWTQRRRGRSTCLTTVASFSEAWRSTSEPRAGTTGRSSGAQPEGVDQGWSGKGSQGELSTQLFPGGTS